MSDYEAFWSWVNAQREKRDLPWYRVEELGGLGNGTLNRRYNSRKEPTLENLRALHDALGLSMRELIEKAGLILPREEQETDATIAEIVRAARAMTPKERRQFLEIMRVVRGESVGNRPSGSDGTT